MKVVFRILLVFSLICFTSTAFSNPIIVYIINEFQTAPDSLQRIELHWWPGFESVTLVGWEIVTSYGTAAIDTPIVLDSNYVVIDSTNTSGIFKLDKNHDSIRIHDRDGWWVEQLSYPEYTPFYPGDAPTPPPGASAARFVMWANDHNMNYQIVDWYIDSTPTFGKANDDYPGCIITGKVFDKDSTPIKEATVTALYRLYLGYDVSPLDSCKSCISDRNGYFEIDSLIPGTYRVIAKMQGFYSDTKEVVTYAMYPSTLDFCLSFVGINELDTSKQLNPKILVSPNPFIQSTRIVIQDLGFREGELVDLKIYDLSGQLVRALRSEQPSIVWDGKDNRGKSVPSGVYFLEVHFSDGCLTKKVVRLQ